MARKRNFTGQAAAAAAGLDPRYTVSLPVISTGAFAMLPTAANAGYISRSAMTQLSASQFGAVYLLAGNTNTNNVTTLVTVPFQVDANGALTSGTPASANNISGVAVSTTTIESVRPGFVACQGYQYYNGSTYALVAWTGRVTASNTASCNRVQNAQGAGVVIASSSTNALAATSDSVILVNGYNNGSYPAYSYYEKTSDPTYYQYSSGAAWQSSFTVATSCLFAAAQAFNEAWSPCALSAFLNTGTGSTPSTAWTVHECHSGTTRTNLGSWDSLFGGSGQRTVSGFRLASNRAVYIADNLGAIVTDAAGTVLSSTPALTGEFAPLATSFSGWEGLGNGLFISNPKGGGTRHLMQVSVDGSYSITVKLICTLVDTFQANGDYQTQSGAYESYIAQSGKYLVTLTGQGAVLVQDLSPIASLIGTVP